MEEAIQVLVESSTEISHWENGITKVRLVVTHDPTRGGFFHPLDYAKAARWFAEQEEETHRRFSNAVGPHDDTKWNFTPVPKELA